MDRAQMSKGERDSVMLLLLLSRGGEGGAEDRRYCCFRWEERGGGGARDRRCCRYPLGGKRRGRGSDTLDSECPREGKAPMLMLLLRLSCRDLSGTR